MKHFLFLITTILTSVSFAGKISYKCEQGVGNMADPGPLMHIEGELPKDIYKTGEWIKEKDLLKITIFEGKTSRELKSSDYKLSYSFVEFQAYDTGKLNIEILKGYNQGAIYSLSALDHPGEIILSVLKKTMILKRWKTADFGTCSGISAYVDKDYYK